MLSNPFLHNRFAEDSICQGYTEHAPVRSQVDYNGRSLSHLLVAYISWRNLEANLHIF